MKTMHCGKASTHFLEKAKELENIVLTNKTYQTTRFVRSLLRGITAGLRNLPTLIAIIGEDYNEAILSSNNTEAKNLKNTLDGLMSAETLFLFLAPLCINCDINREFLDSCDAFMQHRGFLADMFLFSL